MPFALILAKMTGIASKVPIWGWALAAALAWGGWHRHKAVTEHHAFEQAKTETAAAQDADVLAKQIESNRQLKAIQEAADAANIQSTRDRAAAASAADAAGRLRQRVAALQAAAKPADPDIARRCDAATEAIDVLADVQRRVAEAAGLYAAQADANRTGWEACAGSFKGLMPP